jgi:hypothetical protein
VFRDYYCSDSDEHSHPIEADTANSGSVITELFPNKQRHKNLVMEFMPPLEPFTIPLYQHEQPDLAANIQNFAQISTINNTKHNSLDMLDDSVQGESKNEEEQQEQRSVVTLPELQTSFPSQQSFQILKPEQLAAPATMNYTRPENSSHYSYPYQKSLSLGYSVHEPLEQYQPRTQQHLPNISTESFQFPLNSQPELPFNTPRLDLFPTFPMNPVVPQQHSSVSVTYPDVFHGQYPRSHSYEPIMSHISSVISQEVQSPMSHHAYVQDSVQLKAEVFTKEDVMILKSLLQNGEKVKWRHISSKLSTLTGRRATSSTCCKKVRDLFRLPSEKSSGLLATSLAYVVHDAWDAIADEA